METPGLLFSFELCSRHCTMHVHSLRRQAHNLAIFFWIMLRCSLCWRVQSMVSWIIWTCYFLLNYAYKFNLTQNFFTNLAIFFWIMPANGILPIHWEVCRLAIFFWIMRLRGGRGIPSTTSSCQLAIFFWIMPYLSTTSSSAGTGYVTCYFLLNYAIDAGPVGVHAPHYHLLLFSFELCPRHIPLLTRSPAGENLLFSFELCVT